MASEKPLPDRCGAEVTDRVGLEVHDSVTDEEYSSAERLESIVLQKGDVRVTEDANYDELYSYRNNGYTTTAVNLRPSDGSDGDDDVELIELEDDDPYLTHQRTELQGYCERYPMDSGRCYVHGGTAGPPEGNTNAMTHGLRAKRSNFFKQLPEEDKHFVQEMAESWIDNAPFDRDNSAKVNEVYRIAIDQLRMWNALDEMDDGIVYEQVVGQDDDGQPIEVEDENPANLPYDRLDRTTFKKLRELGCLDDPESQNAEATESLADKFAEITTD